MITIRVIEDCPHTRTARAVLHLNPEVIATFAGAVEDREEWMALLLGSRSKDGMRISVTELRVPEQTRSHGNCELVNKEVLDKGVVGVVHSHHTMGAFFSNTDNTQLNPRFPVSIVVAQNRHGSNELERLLGFDYKAEGRATLPCGDVGVVPFTVIPYPLVETWPTKLEPHFAAPADSPLTYCWQVTRTLTGTKHECKTKCGITKDEPASAIFGKKGKEFITEVESKTKARVWYPNQGQHNYPLAPVVHDKRHWERYRDDEKYTNQGDDFLKHWCAYGGD